MTMKLKLDENGHVVVQDGKPVYVQDDGKEVAFDAAGTVQTISRLNGEAKSHRERAVAAEGRLDAFKGIEDPAAAVKALETVKNLDDKKLVDAGEVEKVKSEVSKGFQAQIDEARAQLVQANQNLASHMIGGSFARSQVIAEKLAVPADLVQARFGSAFKVEDGKVVAYGQDGNKIFSRSRPGEIAEFDEALDYLIEQYPHKDHILKSSGASGGSSGANGNGGGRHAAGSLADCKTDAERVAYLDKVGKQ
ncbi:DUF6651 domain-containing protein [Achromobacter sp. PAB15]|uniref:DUF6651 domain-containing protein n=1 Tax=Achromobacter sp. PAB15 TaxID=3233048 RepID=UPI003F914BA3